MAFTILYLLWRYNDVIDGLSDFGGGEAWDFLPVCRMHAQTTNQFLIQKRGSWVQWDLGGPGDRGGPGGRGMSCVQ